MCPITYTLGLQAFREKSRRSDFFNHLSAIRFFSLCDHDFQPFQWVCLCPGLGGGGPHPCTLHQGDEWCWPVLHKQVGLNKVPAFTGFCHSESWKTGKRRMPTMLPGWKPGLQLSQSCRDMWRRTTPLVLSGTPRVVWLQPQPGVQEDPHHHPLDPLHRVPHLQWLPALDPVRR